MVSRAILLLVGLLILAFTTVQSSASTIAEPREAAPAATGAFDKISGTIKGTYHLGFNDYVQNYDAVTTANLVWEEGDYFADCHCHTFFPTGNIDWSYRYEVKSESLDCTDTYLGQLAAGTGLQDKSEQMLVFWDVPGDDTQYYFSGSGGVTDAGVVNCEGGLAVQPIEFLSLPQPEDIVTTTPTFPALAPQASSTPLCDAAPLKIARTATRITGSCYDFYAEDESSLEYVKYEWDLQVAPEPIIFIHGFLGSEINCGTDQLWPHVGLLDRPQLLQMALADDGVSPAPGACAATVGNIVKRVIIDVYGSTVDFINQLQPGGAYFFPWDWRKAPQESLASLDNYIQTVRAAHDNSKVVIMAHSYGGLLARLYMDNASAAENVARVITIGTPAWGSPKALFPLYAGVEAPGGGGLNRLLNKQNLHEFARNLAGDYYLYPSANYGNWLTIGPYSPPPLGPQEVLNYIASLGGNTALLSQALQSHAAILDTPYVGPADAPDFEIIVGTGLPTITSIHVLGDGYVTIGYGNGDETVPAKSAARGALGPGNPNKAHTYYSCRVSHVDLPGDSQITDAIKDFLKFGDPIDGLDRVCPYNGFQLRIFRLPAATAAVAGDGLSPTSTPPVGPMSIDDAVEQGIVQYLDLPNEKFIVAGTEIPEIALPQGAFLEVTPLAEGLPDGKGQPVIYGPLDGQVTTSVGASGPVVLVDGNPAPLDGDVNCDEQVNALDALLLLLDAGGTPGPQPGGCAAIGSGADPFGDVDCDGSATAMDALADLQIASGVSLTLLDGCNSSVA
jgi:pimeloyl-ACP methyl ester carboxylesterase